MRRSAGCAALLLALNAAICGRLFRVEYTQHFNSVEGFFIALARYLSRHWGHLSWWPLWHCGMPFRDTYVPLLHLSVAAVAGISNVSAARAYHEVTACAYALGAVILFFMAMRLGAPRLAAFLAALTYSLFSPSALLNRGIAADLGGWFNCRRLQVLTVYGEGPHVSSLALLLLTILALQYALERRNGRSFALAALSMALLFLTNVPGSMATGIAVFCWISVQPTGRRAYAWLVSAGSAGLAYAIACYGVPPATLATVAANSAPMHGGFHAAIDRAPVLLPLLLGGAAIAGYLLSRARLPLYARFALVYLAVMLVLVETARAPDFELLPQAKRLHLELELPACMLIGGMLAWIYARSRRWAKPVFIVAIALAGTIQARNYRSWARAQIRSTNPATRSEYASAEWLDTHLHEQRVYVSGTDDFWLNAFSDNPQVEGCCDQGLSMPLLRIVPYIVSANANAELTKVSVNYLEALGAQAFVVSGPESTEEYKRVQAPERFEPWLPVLARIRGETIYRVPQRSDSLAHVLHAGEAIPRRATWDVQPVELDRYAGAIEDTSRPAADMAWADPGAGRIHATLQQGDLVSVQIGWADGWQAVVNGEARPVSSDGLGFILIAPDCAGDCEIRLNWRDPEMNWLLWISVLAIGGAATLIAINPGFSAWAKPR